MFLDNAAANCADGAKTYDPSTRSCGQGAATVYTNLASFADNLPAGATSYMRAGNYYRTTTNGTGALTIAPQKAGTSTNPTIVRAYPGESQSVVVATAADKFQYNPDPADTSGALSANYYPNPAVQISADYSVVDGVKTFGQVVLRDSHDSTIRNSDLGGGGPSTSQGQVVALYSGYNYLVQNNKIHHSCWGESEANGSALMGYAFHAIIENNEFHSNVGSDIRLKDLSDDPATGTNNSTRILEVRFNFLHGGGLDGISNAGPFDNQIAGILIHHNLFLGTGMGVNVPPTGPFVVYNNTFVNSPIDIFGPNLSYFNNVFFHSLPTQAYWDTYGGLTGVEANYNLYYSSPSASWLKSDQPAQTTLAEWKAYSNLDVSSIEADPVFVHASGSAPPDFKRASYAESFTASTYGPRAGAYATGTETIGVAPADSSCP